MIKTQKINDVTIITLNKMMNATNSNKIFVEVQSLLSNHNVNIIFNCEHLCYISSIGLSTFMSLQKEIDANNGMMKFESLRTEVMELFIMSGLAEVLQLNNKI